MNEVKKSAPKLNAAQRQSLNNEPLEETTKVEPRKVLTFPDEQIKDGFIPCTIANVRAMLDGHGIDVKYNMMKKEVEVRIPSHKGTIDNMAETSLAQVMSLATSYGMSTANVAMYMDAIADENAYHPFADWIRGKAWDGVERIDDICATIEVADDYPVPLRDELIRKWLLSVVAAVLLPGGFHGRGVLTLQGAQGIGKTSWLRRIVSDPLLRDSAIKVDHHLDPSNKDSVLGAIRHTIVELGEVDSAFKKDIARLKGFITADKDKIRRPYARREAEYARRTVFMASVNEANFLVDPTGNTRWWTIRCKAINYMHDIDMQQVFAQLAVELESGAEWWLDSVLERALEKENQQHRMASVVEDLMMNAIDTEADGEKAGAFTASGVLIAIGIERPTNAQAREAGTILRRLFGEPKRIKGREKWRVPFLDEGGIHHPPPDVADRPNRKPIF
ncbi:virulence-associated E family protein [Sphingobium sp. CFD-1]|uniref:virulence-associated E family protein n=1 Tax=Sphingobium sp. CFD-1 TaxID=2878545 RepID=UPI00214B1248|nr:virulence-associated E family protein [Sphingobium sp. CFD-1]